MNYCRFLFLSLAILTAVTLAGCKTRGRDVARQSGEAPRAGVFRQTVTTPFVLDLPTKSPTGGRQTAQDGQSFDFGAWAPPTADSPGFSARTVTTEWETPEDAERPSTLYMGPDGSLRVEMGQTRKFVPRADLKAMQWGSVALAGALILFGAWNLYRTWNWRGGIFLAAGFGVLIVGFTVQEYAIYYISGLVGVAALVGWALTKGYRAGEKESAADAAK